MKSKNNKIKKFFARTLVTIMAVLGVSGASNKLLSEAKPIVAEKEENSKEELKEILDISTERLPIKWEALDENNMGRYFKMCYDAFMEKYNTGENSINELINSEDPSIKNIIFTKDLYTLLKAYYADLSGEELPFDESNFDMHKFNLLLETKKIDYWTKESGVGLFLNQPDGEQKLVYSNDENPILKAITYEYITIIEGGDLGRNPYFARLVYNVFSDENQIGLKNWPTTRDINHGTEEARKETKFYQYYKNIWKNKGGNNQEVYNSSGNQGSLNNGTTRQNDDGR